MKPGQYIAIPTDDLELPDSPEHWIKGQEYQAIVEPGGVMHLQGELAVSHYTAQAVERIRGGCLIL